MSSQCSKVQTVVGNYRCLCQMPQTKTETKRHGMRIGFFLDEWRDGGVPVFLDRLEKFLTAEGHQVFLFLAQPHPKRDPTSRRLYELVKARLGERCVSLDLISLPRAWRAPHFQQALFSCGIECLLINHYYHHIELISTFATDIPLISTAHNDADCYYHEYLRSMYLVRAHVAVSQRIWEKSLQLTRPEAAHQIKHIPYGVDESAHRFQAMPQGPLRVIYSARLDAVQKRCEDLVPVWKEYVKNGGNGELIILGTGKHEAQLRQGFREELEKGSVIMRGQLSSTEALDQMAQADVLLNLSNFEGLPQVVLEGTTLGLYPLLSDIESGHREIVEQLGMGTLCHVGDVGGFARELRQLESGLGALRQQRQNLRDRALSYYSFKVCGKKYCEMLQEIALITPVSRKADMPKRSLRQQIDRMRRWAQYRRHFGTHS